MLTDADLNLLVALNALLSEGSVSRAAERLGLSESAMSRTLARLRETTGDDLLVRAGRAMVPTPRALALRDRVKDLVEEASAVLRPDGPDLNLSTLERMSTVRANDGFTEALRICSWRTPHAKRPACACALHPSPIRTCARCGRD